MWKLSLDINMSLFVHSIINSYAFTYYSAQDLGLVRLVKRHKWSPTEKYCIRELEQQAQHEQKKENVTWKVDI